MPNGRPSPPEHTVPTDPARAGTGSPVPAAVLVLVGLAAAVVLLGGLRVASSIVGPLVLAFVIAVGVYPVQQLLDDHMPRWTAVVLTIVVTYLGLGAFVGLLAISAAQFTEILPEYGARIDQIVRDTLEFAQRFGVSQEQIDEAVGFIDPASLFDVIGSVLFGLVGTFSNLLFILVLLFFLLIDAGTMPQRMAAVADRAPGVARSLRELTSGIRRFLVVTTIFGAVVAVIDVGILYLFGVPLPLLWGLLSFVTNYIPNVGFVIGLIPPAIFALLEGGPVTALWVVALWSLANFVVQTLVQPKIVGDAVGLSVSATVLSVFVWGWVLGVLGALLAVPLSLAAKELLFDEDSPRGWISPLITSWTRPRRRADDLPIRRAGTGAPGEPPGDPPVGRETGNRTGTGDGLRAPGHEVGDGTGADRPGPDDLTPR